MESKTKVSRERKEILDAEAEKLHKLYARPKLLHVSALKQKFEGNVFVTQWDYDHLPDALKGVVRPVTTEGMNLQVYPKDFFRWPEQMGLEAYRSAYEYALAYMKLHNEKSIF